MIYLIRHGEPLAGWGVHPDPGLSELGHLQAEKTAQKLLGLNATSLVSSPMLRCQETAQHFAEALAAAPLSLEDRIAEVVTPPTVDDRQAWLRQMMSGTWGEAGEQLTGWRDAAFEYVSTLPENTAVFSHFVAINAIVSKVMESENVRVFSPGHCSITVLKKTDAGLTVDQLGDEGGPEIL